MDVIRWQSRPKLRKPFLLCAFKGWNDGAESASLALGYLAGQWNAQPFATIDPEEFFDFQVVRPTVRLVEGRTREIVWPQTEISAATPPGQKRDVALLLGLEPNLRWRTFCDTMIGLARELGVEQVITLGALLADVPHTRPVQITGIASDPALVQRYGFGDTRYEGPTGIVGVLHDRCARAGLESISLWAPVPHYVAAVSSPKAALALVDQLCQVTGLEVDTAGLREAATEYEQRLDEAVAREPEVKQLVEQLEERIDQQESAFGDIPSGDSIAQEFQRFLRDQSDG